MPEGEGEPDDQGEFGGADPFVCDADSDCVARELCLGGTCVIATCDPFIEEACDAGDALGSHCCEIAEQCSTVSFTCEPDLDVGPCDPADINCVQCTTQEQCAAGQICSAALCLDAAGRDECTASFQCADGEHCDRGVFLCVPIRPCSACSALLPHLCCFDDEVCESAAAGGLCVVPPPRECEVDDDCGAGLFCGATGQCVQCEGTSDCGPGLECNVDEGVCS